MLDLDHLRTLVIRPALLTIGLHSPAAETLVLATGLVESEYAALRQHGGGPALGFWQMEPATCDDCWTNFLDFRPQLKAKVLMLMVRTESRIDQLAWNLRYGAAMCRIKYRRAPGALPDADNAPRMAAYWREFYNSTAAPHDRSQDFIDLWRAHIG